MRIKYVTIHNTRGYNRFTGHNLQTSVEVKSNEKRSNNMWHFGSFSLSKREIIASIVILALMFTFGFMIHGAINDSLMLKYQEYNTALQINNDSELFKYAMQTDIGNSFVYGELKCVDPVTYPEIGGEYSCIEKVKEKYTRHTRTVTTTVNGKTQTRTEVYYTWDRVGSESLHSKKITFLGVEFDYGQIDFPGTSHIKTIKESSKIRYKYYGAPTACKGTLYSNLRNNTINDSRFNHYSDIGTTLELYKSSVELVLFWIGWILLTGGLIFGFIYIDNHWLEDSSKAKRYN